MKKRTQAAYDTQAILEFKLLRETILDEGNSGAYIHCRNCGNDSAVYRATADRKDIWLALFSTNSDIVAIQVDKCVDCI